MSARASARLERWVQADDVLWRRALDAVVLLSPAESVPLVLAGTGPALWEELKSPTTLADIASHLAAVFGTDADIVAKDIEPVLARLAADGAIRDQP